MRTQTIAFTNHSSVATDDEVRATLPAIQRQLNRDLAPSYSLDVEFQLVFRGQNDSVSEGEWRCVCLDYTSDAEALGYHDLTENGDAISFVGLKASIEDGATWTEVVSHELLEMAVDPTIDQTVFSPNLNRDYALEVADAVERFTYQIDGVTVSDFVLPSFWKDGGSTEGIPLSFCAQTFSPFSVTAGGYLSYVDRANPGLGWQQVYADRKSKPGTSRGARRRAHDSGKVKRRSEPRSA